MDPSKYSRLKGSSFASPLTRSEGFWMDSKQQNISRPAPEDIGMWKELIQSQSSLVPQTDNPKSLALTKKAPLPEIERTSPRRNDVERQNEHEDDNDDVFMTELCFKKSKKQLQGPTGLSSASYDSFSNGTDRGKRNTRLRPLGISRLSSVPEGRGPSAFHTRQLPPVEQGIPERPLAPTPLISPRRTPKARVSTPLTTPRRRDHSMLASWPYHSQGTPDILSISHESIAPAPSPENGIAHRGLRGFHSSSYNFEDTENWPPSQAIGNKSKMTVSNSKDLQLEKISHTSSQDQDNVSTRDMMTSPKSVTTVEVSSQNKRPSPQDNQGEPTSDISTNSPLNKRKSYLERMDMYHNPTSASTTLDLQAGDQHTGKTSNQFNEVVPSLEQFHAPCSKQADDLSQMPSDREAQPDNSISPEKHVKQENHLSQLEPESQVLEADISVQNEPQQGMANDNTRVSELTYQDQQSVSAVLSSNDEQDISTDGECSNIL